MIRPLFLLVCLAFSLTLFAERPDCRKPMRFFAACESNFLDRERAGGSWQEGLLFGGQIGIDRVKPKGFYYGVDAYYLSGTLMGCASNGLYAESRFQVSEVEGRLGWTFGFCCAWRPTITPFIGYGYYRDSNHFHCDCPMQVRFESSYNDFALGFLTSFSPNNIFSFGLNAKVGLMTKGHNRMSGDPTTPTFSQTTGDRPQYTVEIPFTLYPCQGCRRFEASIVPFYRMRHFGGRENYPFDFIETRLSYYGARLQLGFRL